MLWLVVTRVEINNHGCPVFSELVLNADHIASFTPCEKGLPESRTAIRMCTGEVQYVAEASSQLLCAIMSKEVGACRYASHF